ncbi:MAG: DUF2934 domain-containing protein [Acidobacteria bacterium]|nr:DUF2934 domain-containing protein [Acidobacteriota bacterium]
MARRKTPKVAPDETALPTPAEEMRDQRLERVAARAYEIYEARGGEAGQDLDDWLQAEREVDLEIAEENRED